MTNDVDYQGQDVFDDAASTSSPAKAGEMAFTSEDGKGINQPKDDEVKNAEPGENEIGTPPTNQDDDNGVVVDAKGQKMIPEHRFKAALKAMADQLEEKTNNLKDYETPVVQVPDRDIDPEGHDLHVRMEASKQVMMEMRQDYQETINHYAELAKENELLNQAVANHPLPAKLAYDIAKRDLEIKEALQLKNSDEFKEFQEWRKTRKIETNSLNSTITQSLRAVPNLNRTTSAPPNRNFRQSSDGDDDLFRGAL